MKRLLWFVMALLVYVVPHCSYALDYTVVNKTNQCLYLTDIPSHKRQLREGEKFKKKALKLGVMGLALYFDGGVCRWYDGVLAHSLAVQDHEDIVVTVKPFCRHGRYKDATCKEYCPDSSQCTICTPANVCHVEKGGSKHPIVVVGDPDASS